MANAASVYPFQPQCTANMQPVAHMSKLSESRDCERLNMELFALSTLPCGKRSCDASGTRLREYVRPCTRAEACYGSPDDEPRCHGTRSRPSGARHISAH